MKNILVLGGTGAMGAPLVEQLALQEYQVYVTSRQKHLSTYNNIIYLQGNAHEIRFLESISDISFDVIVDFMNYSTNEFEKNLSQLLKMTKQYIFLSSARVYAGSADILREDSPRLLDTIYRKELKPNSYALAKAMQEDLLKHVSTDNWTIIRPYITYNSDRLQLGAYEKEQWLYRALKGQTVWLPAEIAARKTSMTDGRDVAKYIIKLFGNPKSYGQIIQIASSQVITWEDICNIYTKTIQEETERKIAIIYTGNINSIQTITKRKDQFQYDRLFDRMFDCHLLEEILDEPLSFTPAQEGLSRAVKLFLASEQQWKKIAWEFEGYMDHVTHERIPIDQILTVKSRIKYIIGRIYGAIKA